MYCFGMVSNIFLGGFLLDPNTHPLLLLWFETLNQLSGPHESFRTICYQLPICFPVLSINPVFTVMCLSIGTPKNYKFSIWNKWKIYYI